MDLEKNDDFSIRLGPARVGTWNTLGQPDGISGQIGYNTSTSQIELYDGDEWIEIPSLDSNNTFTGTNIFPMVRQSNAWHAYGGFQAQNETIAISTVDVWYHITNAGNNLWGGLEAYGLTLSGDVMTFTNTGDYIGEVSVTLSGLNGKDFQIRLYNVTQSEQMGYIIGATTTGATNFTNIALPLYIEATAGDQMRMEVRCITDNSDPTFRSAVFYMTYLHD